MDTLSPAEITMYYRFWSLAQYENKIEETILRMYKESGLKDVSLSDKKPASLHEPPNIAYYMLSLDSISSGKLQLIFSISVMLIITLLPFAAQITLAIKSCSP